MKTLYFDCFSGISGDMTVGALLDIGVPEEYLLKNLDRLGINDEYSINIKKSIKNGIQGTDFDVLLIEKHKDNHHGRNLFDIEGIIDKSGLNDNIKAISKKIFYIIAEAEAKVHGKGIYDVHFHEVGAVDSIIDIVGAAICIDYIRPDRILSSAVNTGSGFVKCQHGLIPVPAPATLNILKDIPVYCDEREFELTTPTGAAILKALALDFKKISFMKIKKVGYGCGKRDTDKPNVLRVILCEEELSENCILEATIDDMNPQIYGYLMDRLFEAGAKDVYLSPVYMKKNRPGIVLTVTAPANNEESIKEIIFRQTTTIGIRKFNIDRTELQREIKGIDTEYGRINFKISRFNEKVVNASPEYEDLKKAALSTGVPLKEIYLKIGRITSELFNS